jgi:hypothetical protein
MTPWFFVECADNRPERPILGEIVTVLVSPKLDVRLELRSQDQVERDAVDKGCEISFCSAYSGASRFHMEKLQEAVLLWLMDRYPISHKNRFDVSIEPKVKIRVGTEAERRINMHHRRATA